MKLVKEILYEKFTEESDPVADMGIGAKMVYYRLYKSDQNSYTMYISGDTYNIKDIIKNHKFKWDDINYAWKSKFSMPKQNWEINAPILFTEIEKVGGHIVQPKGKLSKFEIDMDRSFFIPGYEHWEYPYIPDGNGAKVYFKQWHHHAPVIGVTGKGSYLGRAVLRYDGYQFTQGSHMWERTYDSEEVNDLIEYFKSRGYDVIDGRKKMNEKFEEHSDPIKDLEIGIKHELKTRYWNYPDEKIDKILSDRTHKVLLYKNTYILIYYVRSAKKWRAITDIYPKQSGSFLSSYDETKEGVIRRVKLGIGKKINKLKTQGKLEEKFVEKSDPIKDMGIGIGKFLKIESDRLANCNYNELQKEFDIQKYQVDNEDFKVFICVVVAQMIIALGNKETVPNAFHDAYIAWQRHIGDRRKIPGAYFTKVIIVQILKDKYGIEWDAQKVYEKFTEKSDPIKDMGIGRIDILKHTHDLYNQTNINKSNKEIRKFLDSLKGKKISGKFKKGFFEEVGEYEFVIDFYEMFFGGSKVELHDEQGKYYYVIPNTQYQIG